MATPTPRELEAEATRLINEAKAAEKAAEREAKAAERGPKAPREPKKRSHHKHPTPRCARPGCMKRLPPNRMEGSKLHGSDLCTPCGKERYEAMVKSPEGQAYWREWCAKEYSAASMVSEPEKVRRADGKVVDAKRVTEGPKPKGASQNPKDYSQEKLRAMALAAAKALEKADR